MNRQNVEGSRLTLNGAVGSFEGNETGELSKHNVGWPYLEPEAQLDQKEECLYIRMVFASWRWTGTMGQTVLFESRIAQFLTYFFAEQEVYSCL